MPHEFSDPNFEVSLHSVTKLFRAVLDENAKYTETVGEKLDVNPTDFDAMGHLMSNGVMTAGELAKAVGLSPGAATAMIDRLESIGHVKREPNPDDRRGVLVTANPRSVEMAWELLSPLIRASESALSHMKPSDRKAVESYLNSMLEAYEVSKNS
jgi:DNA-binding MarR family transcriptional regulator